MAKMFNAMMSPPMEYNVANERYAKEWLKVLDTATQDIASPNRHFTGDTLKVEGIYSFIKIFKER
jgi:isoamylase